MNDHSRTIHAPAAAAGWLAGAAILAAMFLGIALWNGFPLMFYDTGGYLTEGLEGVFLVERSPVYSLLLRLTGAGFSLWPVVGLQAVMTGYLIAQTARIDVPGLSLKGLCAIGGALMALTAIGWYVGQVEPDCMTALLVLGSYLLLFRQRALGRAGTLVTATITGLAVASHPSHLGLMGGLLILAAGLRVWAFVRPRQVLPELPRPKLGAGLAALALALALILASNAVLARGLFISRSGPVFIFARLMQDGIVKRLLDETCPQSGYRLCAYRGHLKTRADAWLWGENSVFHLQGGFSGSQPEASRMIADSLRRYPVMHLRAAIYDSVLQFFMFRTGDGIESQAQILRPGLSRMAPHQLSAYLTARQQTRPIPFRALNMLHVTVGMLSLLGLLLLLHHAARRRCWGEAVLPGLVLAALIGNAIICGTFSNPHDRYQSRLLWLPTLTLLLAVARNPRALQPVSDQTA